MREWEPKVGGKEGVIGSRRREERREGNWRDRGERASEERE